MSHRIWTVIASTVLLGSSLQAQQALHCEDLDPTVAFDAIRAFECVSRADARVTEALDRIAELEKALQELSSAVADIDVNAPTLRIDARVGDLEEVVAGLEYVPAGGTHPETKAIISYFSEKGEKTCPDGWSPYELAKDRFIVGAGGKYTTIGDTGGEESVALKVAEMPIHAHRVQRRGADIAVSRPAPGNSIGVTETIRANEATTEAGGNQPHNNMPPYIALYFCKKD